MSPKNIIIAAAAAIIIAILGITFINNPSETDHSPTAVSTDIQILTTFFPLYDFTREIVGDESNIDVLFTQTPEVSSFKPADIQKVNNSDIIIKNGAGLEPVLDELIAASDNQDVTVVDTSQEVPLQEFADEEEEHDEHHDEHADEHEDEHEEEEEHAGHHHHEGPDPHIWLDPNFAIIQVETIADALSEADPANAKTYQANAAAYIAELEELDQQFAARTATFTHHDFVAFHPAFNYLTSRYGLNQAAVIQEFPGQEPTPQYLAEVVHTIEDLGITAIFSEPQFSPRVLDSIAHDTGLTVRVLDPLANGTAEDSYISIMQANLQSLTDALQ